MLGVACMNAPGEDAFSVVLENKPRRALVFSSPCICVVPTTHSSKDWFNRARVASDFLCRSFVLKYMTFINSVASVVESCNPRWDHIITSGTFNRKLAKSSLLAWPSRDRLCEQVQVLYKGIKDTVRMHAHWNLRPAIEEDPAFADDLKSGNMLFEAGRMSITMLAGTRIILELSGDAQSTAAGDLLSKKSDILPLSMRNELTKIVANSST